MWIHKFMIASRIKYILKNVLCNFSSYSCPPKIAVVGGGPAGFYCTQRLLKEHSTLEVDVYEKQPVPFGLVRFGVAPDHPEVKNCINSFLKTAQNDRFTFIGNVCVGRDVTVGELCQAYTAVVLSYGAANDRQLCIPGEDLPNVVSARSFVGWYNGLPEDVDLKLDLNCETAIVLGHGNVALDVARLLLTPIDLLKKTDITECSLEALSSSKIKKVFVIGRRGPLQVSFTIKEFREMITLQNCRTVVRFIDIDNFNAAISSLPRPRRRLSELVCSVARCPSDKYTSVWADATREWHLRFLLSPVEALCNPDSSSVQAVKFAVNRLEGSDIENMKALPTGDTEIIPCGLVLKSIGYKGSVIDESIPFNSKHGIIPNLNSRVEGCPGVYCCGWVSNGPVFVILGTMSDAFRTARVVLSDIASCRLSSATVGGAKDMLHLLHKRGVKVVSFNDWKKIDQEEVLRGHRVGKSREKITSVNEFLQIASS